MAETLAAMIPNFEARIWSSKYDGIVEIDTWDNKLTPLTDGRCPVHEWAREHITSCWDDEEIRDTFLIPADWECYEVVFQGYIYGGWDNMSDEWDEEIEVLGTPAIQQLPVAFLFPPPEKSADGWNWYHRTNLAEMIPWTKDLDMTGISISQVDLDEGSPKVGDMIARNPSNHQDKWLISKAYFEDNFAQLAIASRHPKT